MDVIDKARELAAAIENSEEKSRFRRLEIELEKNQEAKALWTELYNYERRNNLNSGKEMSPTEQQQLAKLRIAAKETPLIAEYLKAQLNYFNMLSSVNFILKEASDTPEISSLCGKECAECTLH